MEYAEAADEVLAFYGLPEAHRRKMRTTNMLERVFCELRRRTRVVRVFPDEKALIRLVSCVLMELEMEWEGRRYVSMEGKVYGRCL